MLYYLANDFRKTLSWYYDCKSLFYDCSILNNFSLKSRILLSRQWFTKNHSWFYYFLYDSLNFLNSSILIIFSLKNQILSTVGQWQLGCIKCKHISRWLYISQMKNVSFGKTEMIFLIAKKAIIRGQQRHLALIYPHYVQESWSGLPLLFMSGLSPNLS